MLEIQPQTVFYPGFSKQNIASVQAPVLRKNSSSGQKHSNHTSNNLHI